MRYQYAFFPAFTLALRYLVKKSLRTIYMTVVLLIAFTSYTLLIALGLPFAPTRAPKAGQAGNIRIKALYGALPERYAKEIVAMPGIRSVRYGDFMPALCRSGVVAQINGYAAVGAAPKPDIAQLLKPAELQAWRTERNSMLVGYVQAKRCHWHTGMLLTLQGGMGSHPTMKVHIVAIYHSGSKYPGLNQTAFVHYDYLDGLNPPEDQGAALWMSANAADSSQAARLAVAVDALFADRSPPTESNANTASQGALAQFGNVLKIVEFVMAAVFACALLVTVNVATHAAAERRTQFTLLNTLGFSRLWLAMLTLVELLYVAILGCGLGLALGLALLHWIVGPLLESVFAGSFTAPAGALYLAPALAAGIILVSALIPTWEIFRVRAAKLSTP